MIKLSFRNLVVLLVTLLTLLAVPVAAVEKGGPGERCFLWKAASQSTTVFILGSIHLARGDIYPLPEVMEASFAEAEVLALEADPSSVDHGNLLSRMLSSALYPEGETVKGHISRETYDLLRQEAVQSGLPLASLERMRPWFLAMTLESLAFLRLGFDPANGIDLHFAREAKGVKRIVELESFDFQIKLLSGLSEREQELFLLYTLKDLARLEKGIDALIAAWRTGDNGKMESLLMESLKESPDLAPIYEKFFFRRNRAMEEKIESFLSGRETVFVVVGAAHLVGKQGIIELLREKGYKVGQM